jgi:hypothetical protein
MSNQPERLRLVANAPLNDAEKSDKNERVEKARKVFVLFFSFLFSKPRARCSLRKRTESCLCQV